MAFELILGGARSGKSRLAEQRAAESELEVVYFATAQAWDAEMQSRIDQHREQRPAYWHTVEEPIHLAQQLQQHAREDRVLLVDCLTLWLTNLLLSEESQLFENERQALLETLNQLPGQQILVSNEVGWGIVPMGELSRRFQDEAGRLHQALAQQAKRVTLTVAGLPLTLKDED